jgi:hypothetical protein
MDARVCVPSLRSTPEVPPEDFLCFLCLAFPTLLPLEFDELVEEGVEKFVKEQILPPATAHSLAPRLYCLNHREKSSGNVYYGT